MATIVSGQLSTDFIAGNTVDNYILKLNDRILIKDQSNQVENGIYIITSDAPVRTLDLLVGTTASGVFVFVKSGVINASLGWICNSQDTIVGTDPLNFTEFTGLSQTSKM